jgi:Endonuclease/Exonuclease/phosphatase family
VSFDALRAYWLSCRCLVLRICVVVLTRDLRAPLFRSRTTVQACVYGPMYLFLALWCLVICVPLVVWLTDRLGLCLRETALSDVVDRDQRFSVLSWNVHRGVGLSANRPSASSSSSVSPASCLDACAQVITESEATVIGLQELREEQARRLSQLTGMEFRFYRPPGTRSHCGTAVLSRFEILETRQCAFKHTAARSSRSQCALAVLLNVANTNVWYVVSRRVVCMGVWCERCACYYRCGTYVCTCVSCSVVCVSMYEYM